MTETKETHTQLLFGKDARMKLYAGLDKAAQAVECTLGPKGKTVVIAKKDALPIVTKDGVTVAKNVNLKDPAERIGAEILKEAATHTNETAGDGTTTSTVLTHSLVREGLALLDNHPAKEICRAFDNLTSKIVEWLANNVTLVTSVEKMTNVATISANGDSQIGDIIAKAIDKVGCGGIVSVEDAKGLTTNLTFVEGMQIERGYVSPYFVNNDEKMKVTYKDARVLVTDKKLTDMKDILPLLERSLKESWPLLIVAEEIEGAALHTLVVNKMNNGLKVVAIRAPGYGMHKVDLLNDLCTFTGATLVSSVNGLDLQSTNLTHLGSVKTVVVDAKTSLLVATPAAKARIDEKLAVLNEQLKDVTLSRQDKDQLNARIAKLSANAAIINVGGATDVEIIEKKYRIEDALNATRAAVAEGILPGGGMALFRASRELPSVDDAITKAYVRALQEPIRTIARNAGASPEVVINELVKLGSGISAPGWNAATDEFVQMIDSGIVDPMRVTRTALKNATSVATTFLSMDAAIIEE